MNFEDSFFNIAEFEVSNQSLGKGAFGEVILVENIKDHQLYAAKIINIPPSEFDGHSQKIFLRESDILCKLSHPSIVKFYGINFQSFKDQPILSPTIIMEYVPKGSLKDILNKEKKSIADREWNSTKKCICLLGIADAMRYLHKKGILHRDLKPENIMIDENYYPKVCDFGLSKCFSKVLTKSIELTLSGEIGTPLYMSPELISNGEHYGIGIDVYAFAFIAYEIMTGEEPFASNRKKLDSIKLFNKIMSGERPKFNDFVTEKMKELISKCWSQKPEDRPTFDEIFDFLSSDFSLYNEDIDEDEVNDYLDLLKERKMEDSDEKQNQELLETLKMQNGDLLNQIKNYQNHVNKLQSKLQSSNQQTSDFKSQLQNYKKYVNDLQSKLQSSNQQTSDFKSQLQNYKKQVIDLQKKLQSSNHQAKKIQNQLNQQRQQNNELLNQISDLKKTESYEREYYNLKNKVDNFKRSYGQLISEVDRILLLYFIAFQSFFIPFYYIIFF